MSHNAETVRRRLIAVPFLTVLFVAGSFSPRAWGHDRIAAPHANNYQAMFAEPSEPLATDVPDRILVSWKKDPANSFSVTWRNLNSEAAIAEIAPALAGPDFVKHVERANATTSPLKTNRGDVQMHAVTFDDLQPETLYAYRVGCKRTVPLSQQVARSLEPHTQEFAWSEWFHCRTAATFEGTTKPLRFVYVGDAQNDVKSHWSRLVREAFRDAPQMTFMLHAGDLVNRGNQDEEWGQWFHAGGFLFGTIPQVAIPGNHEYDVDLMAALVAGRPPRGLSRRWAQRFEFPENGPAEATENIYYIDLQGLRLIGLDSNIDPVFQAKWLETVLADNPNRWTVVTHHHPIHSTSRGRDNPQLREFWQPLYDKYKVDLVLQGHDHSYGRTEPLTAEQNVATGARVADEKSGTVYVVSVSGPKMYPLKEYAAETENPFRERGEGVQLFQVIDVTQDELIYQAKTATGKLFDEFRIRKSADGHNTFIGPASE